MFRIPRLTSAATFINDVNCMFTEPGTANYMVPKFKLWPLGRVLPSIEPYLEPEVEISENIHLHPLIK